MRFAKAVVRARTVRKAVMGAALLLFIPTGMISSAHADGWLCEGSIIITNRNNGSSGYFWTGTADCYESGTGTVTAYANSKSALPPPNVSTHGGGYNLTATNVVDCGVTADNRPPTP